MSSAAADAMDWRQRRVGVALAAILGFIALMTLGQAPPTALAAAANAAWAPSAATAAGESLHRCAPRHPQILVYNRIPKAGSSTVIAVLQQLAKANRFDLQMPTPYYNASAARAPILAALASGRRTLVCNHFNFPEILMGESVAYVNVMREPVARCTSEYYYTRYGARNRVLKKNVLDRYGGAPLDECMGRPREELPGCMNCEPAGQARAFCGVDGGACAAAAGDEVLARAWANVRAHYVVAPTENLADGVAVLERLYPDFFSGAGRLLARSGPQKVTHTRQEYVEPGPAARAALAEWADVDVRLYGLVVERFWALHAACGLPRLPPTAAD